METKVCTKCKIEIPLDKFKLRTDTNTRRNDCTPCRNKAHIESGALNEPQI